MNCRRFQHHLFEYVEGSLSASAMVAVEQHLAGCAACREALRKEEALARGLSCLFRQHVEALKLAPEIRRDIFAAARREPVPPVLSEVILGWWTRYAVTLSVGAAVLVLGAVLWLNHVPGSPKSGVETAQNSGGNPPPAVSVQLLSRVPVYQFRREGDTVIDTLSVQTVIASFTLRPDPEK